MHQLGGVEGELLIEAGALVVGQAVDDDALTLADSTEDSKSWVISSTSPTLMCSVGGQPRKTRCAPVWEAPDSSQHEELTPAPTRVRGRSSRGALPGG